jgi:parallel beta-helix repeat protein
MRWPVQRAAWLAVAFVVASAAVAAPAGAAAPSAPSITSVRGGPTTGKMTLKWSAPTSNGGATITSYQYEYAVDGGAWKSGSKSFGKSARSATVACPAPLAPGHGCSYRIRANNGTAGTWSATKSAVWAAPAAPSLTYLGDGSGTGQMSLRWSPPTSNGGLAVRSYEYQYAIDGGTWSAGSTSFAASARSAVVACPAPLSPTHGCSFRLRAKNDVGSSPWSAARPATWSVPPAPVLVSAVVTASAGQATLTFTPPTGNGGLPVTSYAYAVFAGGSWGPRVPIASSAITTVTAAPPVYATTVPCSVTTTGGAIGCTYRVHAVNAAGPSPASASLTVNSSTAPTCAGVALLRGQPDIDAAPAGTTFCITGTHTWTLRPKDGNVFVGPATLDGAKSLRAAFVGTARNVTLTNLRIIRYAGVDQQGAINPDDDDLASGWTLNNLDVSDNANVGVNPGANWRINGGRFHDNGQAGLAGAVGDGVVVDGAEIDHNNFSDKAYTRRRVKCGYEAGGFKWVANNVTVRNSHVHDNACKGLWSDINARNITIADNHVYNNWDEGIFVEISSVADVTGNVVYGNGHRNYNGSGTGCPWLFGGGITVNSSDQTTVTGNHVYGNCNGVTAIQQHRPDGNPGLLQYLIVTGNIVQGPGGLTGASADNGADLTTRSLAFVSNSFESGMTFCALTC